MLCINDKSYCMVSSEEGAKQMGKQYCTNKKCDRHIAQIDFSKVPEWMPICYCDFSDRCGKYLKDCGV